MLRRRRAFICVVALLAAVAACTAFGGGSDDTVAGSDAAASDAAASDAGAGGASSDGSFCSQVDARMCWSFEAPNVQGEIPLLRGNELLTLDLEGDSSAEITDAYVVSPPNAAAFQSDPAGRAAVVWKPPPLTTSVLCQADVTIVAKGASAVSIAGIADAVDGGMFISASDKGGNLIQVDVGGPLQTARAGQAAVGSTFHLSFGVENNFATAGVDTYDAGIATNPTTPGAVLFGMSGGDAAWRIVFDNLVCRTR